MSDDQPQDRPGIPAETSGAPVSGAEGASRVSVDPPEDLSPQRGAQRAEQVLPPAPPRTADGYPPESGPMPHPGLNEHGEPTGHVVVRTWRDVPASIRDHCLVHHGPGVHQHQRLGIWIIVLDEIDPEGHRRKALQALGDLGIARERLASAECERDEACVEVDGLRGLLGEALDLADAAAAWQPESAREHTHRRVLAIREAGLQ